MAISDGAPVSAAASNAAWMSRTSNTSTTGSITQSNSTSSTDKDTGAFVTNGGLGVEENINAGGTIKTADTTQSTDKDTGSIVTEGGVGIEKNLNVGGDGSFAGNLNAANLNGTNTGDVNLTAIGATPNANAASLTAQSLTLQPASSAFGGVVTTAAQSFSGDKTFDDNVTIDGDLTVNGTTTTVNSATLEVTDANVLVNNGGNDASSEGAGLQVERTGTNGNIAYANALASKWKLGALGSESEVMTVGTAQTVSGVKTYTAAEIFQSILQGDQLVDASATGSNASVAATKFNVKVTNGSLVSIRDISSPASSQFFVLTNGTGSILTVVNDNTASTRIITGTAADIAMAIDSSLFLVYDTGSSRWRVVGGSGSGGSFSLAAIGSSPNANGSTYSAGTLNLEPASATFGGVVTTGAQTFAGAKTFSGAISASNLSGTNTGDVDLSTISGTLAIGKGGTGQTTQTPAFNALSPLTTKGDLVVRDASNNVRQAVGTDYFPLVGLSAATNGIGYVNRYALNDLVNIGFNATVSANALTVNILTANLTTPSTTDPILISFRSSANSSGSVNLRSITSALSMTISSGSTLGQTSGQPSYIWIYLIDNSGTVEVALSHTKFSEDLRVTTTAEGGAGAADSATTLYSTTARTNVPIRCIGYLNNTQTTAGTWVSTPAILVNLAFSQATQPTVQNFTSGSGTYITPAGCVRIKVRMVGGGGGGGGSGTADGATGGTGGTTTFGSRTCAGGVGTVRLFGGAGGVASGTGGSALIQLNGARGRPSCINPTTANGSQLHGGDGGGTPFGSGGANGGPGGGGNPGEHYGTGGGGAGTDNTSAQQGGGGAGSGAYYELLYNNPESSYSYAVGAAGTSGAAGTGGRGGGVGFAGYIVVEEFYY